MKLKTKIPVIMALLVSISMIITVAFTSIENFNILFSNISNQMGDSTKNFETIIEVMIEKEKSQISEIAISKEARDLAVKALGKTKDANYNSQLKKVNDFLKEKSDKAGNVEHIFLVDTNGMIFADSVPNKVGTSVADRSYNGKTLEGNQVISETLISKATGAQIVAFTAPIYENGKVIGYAGAAVRAESFFKIYEFN